MWLSFFFPRKLAKISSFFRIPSYLASTPLTLLPRQAGVHARPVQPLQCRVGLGCTQQTVLNVSGVWLTPGGSWSLLGVHTMASHTWKRPRAGKTGFCGGKAWTPWSRGPFSGPWKEDSSPSTTDQSSGLEISRWIPRVGRGPKQDTKLTEE